MAKEQFDIHDCYIEFINEKDEEDGKVRPILVLDWGKETEGLIYFYQITSQDDVDGNKSKEVMKYYYPIVDWEESGLDKKSYVDLYTREPKNVDVKLIKEPSHRGKLSPNDIAGLMEFMGKLRWK